MVAAFYTHHLIAKNWLKFYKVQGKIWINTVFERGYICLHAGKYSILWGH